MLGIIIVAYKNPERTADYINNYLSKLKNQHVVVVVNNASTYNECEKLASLCGGISCEPNDTVGKKAVYILNSNKNLGFAKGNNLGVEFLMRNYPCGYILFSNDDIILEKGLDLQPMIDQLDNDKSIGAIGPDIIGLDGKHQSPHRRVITAYRQIGWYLLSGLRKSIQPSSGTNLFPTPPEGLCYWVSGAFFLMRSIDFVGVGGFDSDTFLYGEEPILAERLRRIGKSMYFYPNLRVIHREGATTHSVATTSRIKQWLAESNCIYYKKYLRTPSLIVRLYKWLVLRKI